MPDGPTAKMAVTFRKGLSVPLLLLYPKSVSRRALLVFADPIHVDLARRALPVSVRPLFGVKALGHDISSRVDVHFFTSGAGGSTPALSLHRQAGQSFATRFENAIETIAKLGYDEVVAIGRDCPALSGQDIDRAFAELKSSKLVLGPDHRGGCYLIAFRSADRALLRDIRWKKNTDCAQLRQRAGAAQVFLLPVKHDLDSWNDVRLFAHADHALARLASFLMDRFSISQRQYAPIVSYAAQHMRVRQQLPPPRLAA